MNNRRPNPSRSTGVIRLIARREVVERLRAKSYYVVTGLLVAAILATGLIGRLAADDEPEAIAVGVAGAAPEGLADALAGMAAVFDRRADLAEFGAEAEARTALEDGDIDVLLIGVDREAVFDGAIDDQTLAIVQQAWSASELQQRLTDAGLSPEEAGTALAAEPLAAVTLEGDDQPSGLAILTGTLTAILLLLALQTFGGYVLTGVVEEKSTAVVELLLVRVRADQLLAGKLLGIGVTALLQFAAAVVAGLVALGISGVDVPSDIWATVPLALVWFLLGYAFYSTLYALAGSLVARQEEAQAAAAPIISLMIIAYMVVFVFGYVPESTASRVLSLIPPIAPFLMPMRMASGAASVVEVIASLALLLAATVGVWKLTGKIYEQVLLRRGSRIGWRDALTLARRHPSV